MSKQIQWVSEIEAANLMNYKDRKHFRRLVKSGTYPISYRTNPKGRSFEYDAKAIERIKNENAVIIYA